MHNIKAVFFDADDTLVDHKECEKQALKYLFEKVGINYKDEYQNIFRPLDRDLWRGTFKISVAKEDIPVYRFKYLFEILDIKYDDYHTTNELFKEGLSNSTELLENSEEIIKYLHNKGFVLCVVTNGLVELQKPRVVNSKIGKFISYVIVSEEVGAHKPNPLIFNTLLSKINMSPADAIMIGDSLEKDIQGAKNANIRSVWFNPEGMQNKTNILPDYEINSLLQIKNIV